MEHHEFFISTIFNRYIANPLASLLGFHPHHDVVPAHVVMVMAVSAFVILLALLVRRKLSVDNPGVLQQILEILIEGILGLANDIIGLNPRRFFPLLGALFIYILVGNLLGLIPGFMSPTSNINVTASCALVVFFYYNYVGFKENGF